MPEPFLTTVSRTKNDTLQLLSAIQHSPLHAVSSPCICWLLVACFGHVHGASHNVSSRWTKWEGRWMRGKSGQRASKALEPIREGRLRVVRTSLQFYIPLVRGREGRRETQCSGSAFSEICHGTLQSMQQVHRPREGGCTITSPFHFMRYPCGRV